MLELWISVELQRNVAQRMRIKMRTKRMVQDVEILTSGERKRVVSLEKDKHLQTPFRERLGRANSVLSSLYEDQLILLSMLWEQIG